VNTANRVFPVRDDIIILGIIVRRVSLDFSILLLQMRRLVHEVKLTASDLCSLIYLYLVGLTIRRFAVALQDREEHSARSEFDRR
jgi:hypothetical protein